MRKTKSTKEKFLLAAGSVVVLAPAAVSIFSTFVFADEKAKESLPGGEILVESSDHIINPYRYNSLENNISFLELAQNYIGTDVAASNIEANRKLTTEQQLEELTLKQSFSVSEIEKAMSLLGDKDRLRSFVVGDNLNVLKFQLAQVKEIGVLLGNLLPQTDDILLRSQINNQIKFLKAEQKKVEEFIHEQQNEFSLFGWFVNIL